MCSLSYFWEKKINTQCHGIYTVHIYIFSYKTCKRERYFSQTFPTWYKGIHKIWARFARHNSTLGTWLIDRRGSLRSRPYYRAYIITWLFSCLLGMWLLVFSCSLGTRLFSCSSGTWLSSCSLGTWLFTAVHLARGWRGVGATDTCWSAVHLARGCSVQYFFVNWWGSIWTAVRQLAGQVFGCCCYYSTVRQLSGHVFDAAVIFQLSGSCKVTLWMLLSFFSCQAAVLSHFGCCCHSSAVRQLSDHVLDAFVIFQQSGSCLVTFWMLLSLFCC